MVRKAGTAHVNKCFSAGKMTATSTRERGGKRCVEIRDKFHWTGERHLFTNRVTRVQKNNLGGLFILIIFFAPALCGWGCWWEEGNMYGMHAVVSRGTVVDFFLVLETGDEWILLIAKSIGSHFDHAKKHGNNKSS